MSEIKPESSVTQAVGRNSPEEWKPGDIILDLYEVREIFDSGGMGLVYRVYHRGWNIELALKSPRAAYFKTPSDKEKFIREAETWIDLGLHPNIVTCYYTRVLEDIPRIFAEFITEGSLENWIWSEKLYEGGYDEVMERMLDIAIQAAYGIHYAHGMGVIHQDIKPANIMMTRDGIAKVCDFGLSKARAITGERIDFGAEKSVMVSSGGLTRAFSSPEQAAGEALSRKTDIWSWGISVLEMFNGGVSWFGGSAAPAALADYLRMGPENPAIPSMPWPLVELLKKCFVRDPRNRTGSMHEVIRDMKIVYEHAIGKPYPRSAPASSDLHADSLNNRAVSYMDLGRTDEALKALEEALQGDPLHLQANFNLGLAGYRNGKYDENQWLNILKQVFTTEDSWENDFYYSLYLLETGKRDNAVILLDSALEKSGGLDEIRKILDKVHTGQIGNPKKKGSLGLVLSRVKSAGETEVIADTFKQLFKEAKEAFDAENYRIALQLARQARSLPGFERNPDILDLWFALYKKTEKTGIRAAWLSKTLEGHREPVLSICISANGQNALSGSYDGALKLWDLKSGRCIRTIEEHEEGQIYLFLSPDAKLALTGSSPDKLILRELPSGEILSELSFINTPDGVGFVDENDKTAVTEGEDSIVRLWDPDSCTVTSSFEGNRGTVEIPEHLEEEGIISLCMSADGKYAISGSRDDSSDLWRISDGKCIYGFEGHEGAVNAVYLSAEGRWAITAGDDKIIRLWVIDWEMNIPENNSKNEAREIIRTCIENMKPNGNKVINFLSSRKGSRDLSMNDNNTINDQLFPILRDSLGYAGYGWLKDSEIRTMAEELINTEKKQQENE